MIRIATFFIVLLFAPLAFATDRDWDEIEKILQLKGVRQGDSFELKYPRSDLSVKINKTVLDPALGLTSRIVFKKKGKEAFITGEFVVLPKEASAVTRKLRAEGLKITSQYTRIKGSNPKILGMNFIGQGQAVSLVWAFTPALSATGTPMGPPKKRGGTAQTTHSWKVIEHILGRQGDRDGQVLRFILKRQADAHVDRTDILGSSELLFQMMGKNKAATTGRLALTPEEVDPVRNALARQGITVTAVQENMFSRQSQLILLYFWGVHEPDKVAGALKSAIDLTGIRRSR